jgi:hypothetical protein
VTLSNPTAAPVTLLPCPGYAQTLFSLGDAEAPAVNEFQLFRLNCRPASSIPARGELRFEMVAVVPAQLPAGRELSIGWKAVTAQSLPTEHLAVNLTVRVVRP